MEQRGNCKRKLKKKKKRTENDCFKHTKFILRFRVCTIINTYIIVFSLTSGTYFVAIKCLYHNLTIKIFFIVLK